MLIANPIYDVVFKYLMEDSKVAKLLLSAIIEQEILDRDFKPQELTGELKNVGKKKKEGSFIPTLTVYRLDFAAKVKAEEEEKIIIIEIQKAKLLNDVMRFRRYLGKQYQNSDYYYIRKNENGKEVKYGYPIVSIYFLGEQLDTIQGVPIVKVDNIATDLYSGQQIAQKEAFVESLTHKSYIISIPDLSKKRRSELEMILSIFDQSSIKESHHILNVREENFPEKYRSIIKRLQNATAEEEIRSQMELEDDFVSELADYERMIEDARRKAVEAKKEAREAKKAAIAAKKEATEAKKEISEAKKEATKAKKEVTEAKKEVSEAKMKADEAENRILKMVKKSFANGMAINEIADLTGLTVDDIQNMIK